MEKQKVSLEQIHPFFELDPFSDEIMEKMGFEITRFFLALTKDKWLLLCIDWKMETDEYKVKYPVENGMGMNLGNDEAIYINYFFSQIEANEESPRFDYTEEKRECNGFGKVSFKVGIETNVEEPDNNICYDLGYSYAYSTNTKYGLCVYFKPDDALEIEKELKTIVE